MKHRRPSSRVSTVAPPRGGTKGQGTDGHGLARTGTDNTADSGPLSHRPTTARLSNRLTGALLAWFSANRRAMPWRAEPSPYRVWISEIMLQQTQVATVIPYFNRFVARFPDVVELARADQQDVLKLWEGLGYYSRARNLHKAAGVVLAEHGGRLPETFGELCTLPGIGDYTAAAVASIAFGEAVPVVDGNVLRVFTRFWGIAEDIRKPKTRQLIFERLSEVLDSGWKNGRTEERKNRLQSRGTLVVKASRVKAVSKPPALQGGCAPAQAATRTSPGVSAGSHAALTKEALTARVFAENRQPEILLPPGDFNQAIMELGALVCTPRSPQCGDCPLATECVARCEGRTAELPVKSAKAAVPHHRVAVGVLWRKGCVLVQQRPEGGMLAGLWEFPGGKVELGETLEEAVVREFREETGLVVRVVGTYGMLEHAYSHFSITLTAFRLKLETRNLKLAASIPTRWVTLCELRKLPMPRANQHVLEWLEAECSQAISSR